MTDDERRVREIKELELLKETLNGVYRCPCEHPSHAKNKDYPHTQDRVGCPSCDPYHDNYPLFTNAEVKLLLAEARREGAIEEVDQISLAFFEHLKPDVTAMNWIQPILNERIAALTNGNKEEK
jgi:hypothetical protein